MPDFRVKYQLSYAFTPKGLASPLFGSDLPNVPRRPTSAALGVAGRRPGRGRLGYGECKQTARAGRLGYGECRPRGLRLGAAGKRKGPANLADGWALVDKKSQDHTQDSRGSPPMKTDTRIQALHDSQSPAASRVVTMR
jgi:hypothetical protein